MKAKIILALALAAFTAISVSCKKDDPEGDIEKSTIANLAEGKYTGELTYKISEETFTHKNVAYTIEKASDKAISITTAAADVNGVSIPELTIPSVTIEQNNYDGLSTVMARNAKYSGKVTIKVDGKDVDKTFSITDINLMVETVGRVLAISYNLVYDSSDAMFTTFSGQAK